MIERWLGQLVLVFLLAASTSAALAQQARDGGVLRVGIQSEPRSLDPLLVITDGSTGHVVSNIFNTLVRYDAKMQIVPDLATSWRTEDDGRAVDFFLRQGVKFHDGTDFDAAAVKFAFDRILDPANSSPYRTFFKPIEQVVVINPSTVRVVLSQAWPGFFYQLLYVGGMGIPSPTAVKALGNAGFARKPVGTGPFKLADWASGDRIVLTKNTSYYRPKMPYLDRLEFKVIPDSTALTTSLRTGQLDLVRDIPTQLLPLVDKEPGLVSSVKNAYSFDWFALNAAKPPFNDVRVRQAINMAIDRDALAVAVYGKGAKGSTAQIAAANDFHHPKKLPTFTYDPEKAKKLLADAGQSNLKFTLVSSTVKPQLGQEATVIQVQLAKIGVTVTHQVMEHQAWLSTVLRNKNFEASTVAGTGGPEPNSYVMFWTKDNPVNFVSLNNEELFQLVPKAQGIINDAERKKAYHRIQELGAQEASWMALMEVPSNAVMSSKIKSYVHLPYNVSYFDEVWLSQ
ncbi:MAG: ABC transporter substrate-binding protein [Betaproteobacteria bacterium]